MPEERALAFACGDDWLYGVLSMAGQPSARGVLIVVGGPQYRAGSHRQFTLLARDLASAGIPAMRFDYRGMGDSEGGMRTFEAVAEDIRAAIDRFFAETPGLREVVLWGLCDGASAAAMYAPLDARVCALALLNPWVRTEEGEARATIKHYYRARLFEKSFWIKLLRGRFDFRRAARSFAQKACSAFGQRSGADAALPDRMHAALARFKGRVLVMLSGADLTAREFGDLASSRKWLALLEDSRFTRRDLPKADHTCSRREWHDQVVSWTREWVQEGYRQPAKFSNAP